MYKQVFKLAAPVLLVVSFAMGLTLHPAVAADTPAVDETDAAQFARGARTWADTCARCHNMRDPKELRADQWRSAVAHMRVRSGMTGGEARDVLAFLQGGSDAQVGLATQGLAVAPVISDDTNAGKAIYAQTCIACHGADGKGSIPGVTDLNAGDGPLSKTDEELVRNISEGFQSPGSFIAMPAKGGNPTLTEEDIKAVLEYLRVEFGE